MGKSALWVLGSLLALSVLAASGMMYLLHTDSGNRRLCQYVTSQIGTNLGGRLEVDRIEDLRLDKVIARGVRFVPPKGPPAIDVPRVTLFFRPMELLRGKYGWARAEVENPIVRVTELPSGKTNMEELFASPKPDATEHDPGKHESGDRVELNNMVTNGAKLWIGGGSLPNIYLSEIHGIMGIEIDADGKATLRFDEYRGKLDGLPSGHLDFGDVKGQVWTSGKRLLHFDGKGKNKGQPVVFGLDIKTKPTDVRINTEFEEIGIGSIAARMMAVWSTFSPDIDVQVHQVRN